MIYCSTEAVFWTAFSLAWRRAALGNGDFSKDGGGCHPRVVFLPLSSGFSCNFSIKHCPKLCISSTDNTSRNIAPDLQAASRVLCCNTSFTCCSQRERATVAGATKGEACENSDHAHLSIFFYQCRPVREAARSARVSRGMGARHGTVVHYIKRHQTQTRFVRPGWQGFFHR